MLVEVWVAAPRAELASWLTMSELARVDRFRDPADRARSITGAALLRAYAGKTASLPPQQVTVRRRCVGCGGTEHGRPLIDGAQVSLSHSGDWVLLAAAPVPVGVDVEVAPVGAELAEQLLAPGEPADDLSRTWVRKEAVAKATGWGLLRPLSGFRVRPAAAARWYAAEPGYAGAYLGADLDLPVAAAVAIAGAPGDAFEVRLRSGDALFG